MTTETPTPAPVVAQPKTLQEQHVEAIEETRQLWDALKEAESKAKPYVTEYERLCSEWCRAKERRDAFTFVLNATGGAQ